jgi:hypothetical protein
VRTILMYGTLPRKPTYWDLRAESLILELLPKGLTSACEQLQRMKSSTKIFANCIVIAGAYGAITAHLQQARNLDSKARRR